MGGGEILFVTLDVERRSENFFHDVENLRFLEVLAVITF
jgi:hypothetical protein